MSGEDVVSGDGGRCCRVSVFPAAGKCVAIAPDAPMVAFGRLNEVMAAMPGEVVPAGPGSPTVDCGITTELTTPGELVDIDGAADNVVTMTGSVEWGLPVCPL